MLRAGCLLPPTVTVRTQEAFDKAMGELRQADLLAYDTETTGIHRPKDRALFLALSDGKKRYCIGPEFITHPEVKALMEDPHKTFIAHVANFDAWMMHNIGVNIFTTPGRVYDTAVMHLLYNDLSPHSLDVVASQICGIHKYSFTTAFPEVKQGETPGEVLTRVWDLDPERVSHYASLDAYATFKVFIRLRELLAEIVLLPGVTLWNYYEWYELPFTDVLLSMEMAGIAVDRDALYDMVPDLEKKADRLGRWFAKEAGTIVRPTGKKITDFFFKKLKALPLKISEKTKAPSLDKESLKVWKAAGSVHASNLLEWRQAVDMSNRYVANLDSLISEKTLRLHTTFNQHSVRTGRLSSASPNLQNQPKDIRFIFVASEGKLLLVMDYGQVEWRLAAHLSQDKRMMEDIFAGRDAHCSTAALMFELPYDEIIAAKAVEDEELLTDRQHMLLKRRSFAKTLNFGILYGEGPHKLAQQLGITIDEAKELLRKFRQTYPQLHQYFGRVIAEAREIGYCKTILGRPRLLPNLNSSNRALAASDQRKAKNSPIQGSSSDIIKLAMLGLHTKCKFFLNGQAQILLQVHDELVIEVDENLEKDVDFNRAINHYMLSPLGGSGLSVPLTIDKAYAKNWRAAK
jgi:DNA polymerase I